ncbi:MULTISPECIES: AAA family ATPase [unclassified Kosakonia]|uniref:AAA family ATPase n=1 Tax=unclassified Kosakonia TaxID=2632876 RepID=UPI0031B6F4F1
MSRYTGEDKSEQILSAASEWRKYCLIDGGSLFSDKKLWNSQYLAEIECDVVNSQLELEGNFMHRLKEQLASVSAEAKQLTAEMLWLLFLCPSNISARTKRDQIIEIWALSGEPLNADHPALKDAVLCGVGSAGTGFNTLRAREFAYLTNVIKALLMLTSSEREARLSDGFAFAEWLSAIPENASRQFRHMLLFMLFPDVFERIFSNNDRRTIIRAFKPQYKGDFSAVAMDRVLLEIRHEQEEIQNREQLDFYVPPLSQMWQEQPVRHWLMTWNPRNWQWESLSSAIQKTRDGDFHREGWSCNNSNVKVGDTAWLMRVGENPKGIFAVGTVVSEPYEDKHWNADKASNDETCRFVDIDFSRIMDVTTEPFITEERLNVLNQDKQNWFPQQSGIAIRTDSANHLQKLWLSIVDGSSEKITGSLLSQPENLIFFGPPGTGKTYELNLLKAKYVSESQTLTREQWLGEQLSDKAWYEVIFIALVDMGGKSKVAQIAAHEYVLSKAKAQGRMNSLNSTIWATLQTHTSEESTTVKYARRVPPYLFDKIDNSFWVTLPEAQEEFTELIALSRQLKQQPAVSETIKRYEFVTFHQAYSYEDFVEGIRPELDEESRELSYSPKDGVFRRICQHAEADPGHRYAIFIDEINRGNVAKIFGELITLIEPDKRINGDKGMRITLPYSREPFGVPANLDIYGTMNTADRSIALLDTALRRRFRFKELMPDSTQIAGEDGAGNIVDDDGRQINLRKLLDAMNKRIRFLLSRDLMLGHAYLCSVTNLTQLKAVFLNQFIPLLQEYFYEDWHKIQLVFRDIDAAGKLVEAPLIGHVRLTSTDVFGFTHDDFEEVVEYRVSSAQDITPDSIRKIYED